jgi:hypothetical protein
MAARRGTFILTEAAERLPLVRRILRDVREARSRLSRIDRMLTGLGEEARRRMEFERETYRRTLAEALRESSELGVEITPGIRCEALFAFDHQWIGPEGDNKIRPAYFVYNDAQSTIEQWFFSGWPSDRRKVNPKWWHQFRQAPVPRLRIKKQNVSR